MLLQRSILSKQNSIYIPLSKKMKDKGKRYPSVIPSSLNCLPISPSVSNKQSISVACTPKPRPPSPDRTPSSPASLRPPQIPPVPAAPALPVRAAHSSAAVRSPVASGGTSDLLSPHWRGSLAPYSMHDDPHCPRFGASGCPPTPPLALPTSFPRESYVHKDTQSDFASCFPAVRP